MFEMKERAMERDFSDFRFQISDFESRISNPQTPRRRGFTLVEVLVVVAIIGLLVALLLPAINSVRRSAKRTVITTEMKQLVAAIENFKSTIGAGRYPPDGTNPSDTLQFLQGAFPRCPATNYPTQLTTAYSASSVFNPATALVFWLGGAQDSTGAFIGFSANQQNPFDAPVGGQVQISASRLQPSFDFQKATGNTRFVQINTSPLSAASGNLGGTSSGTTVTWNLYQYSPPNNQVGSAPYLYYKAVAGAYYVSTPVQNTMPYSDSSASPPTSFINPKTYQLLCPGLDGKFGIYTTANIGGCPQYPAGTNYDQVNGLDDMTNFTSGAIVGDDTP
jgi:prepilin-type N-terminal cleavage/methylation domain-containing protein